jgi:hypothetical protein
MTSRKRSFIVLLLTGFTIALVVGMTLLKSNGEIKSLRLLAPRFPPFSSDPLESDALIHHIAFLSVYSGLVSDYKLGEIKGILAESWTHDSENRNWSFRISSGLKFENGKPISAEVIFRNFVRTAYLMKQQGSESGVLENLIDLKALTSAASGFSGLTYSADAIAFHFKDPIANLPAKLCRGLYNIADPDLFDASTGEWKDSKRVISSGPYLVEEWTDKKFTLKLRGDYPSSLRHSNAFERITIIDEKSKEEDLGADAQIGFSDQIGLQFGKFYGPIKSIIRYVRCNSFDKAGHFFASKGNRTLFRSLLYRSLASQSISITKSFLPLQIKGVKAFDDSNVENLVLPKGLHITLPTDSQLHDSQSSAIPIQKALVSGLSAILERNEGSYKFVDESLPSYKSESNGDLSL